MSEAGGLTTINKMFVVANPTLRPPVEMLNKSATQLNR